MKQKLNLLKKSVLLTLLISMLSVGTANAQDNDYTSAIGARLGYPMGATYKQFFAPQHAGEAILGWRWGGAIDLAALYEYHGHIVDNLYWFAGGGVEGLFSPAWRGGAGGIALIGGVEYSFNFPLVVSVDWKPSILFGNVPGAIGYNSGSGSTYPYYYGPATTVASIGLGGWWAGFAASVRYKF